MPNQSATAAQRCSIIDSLLETKGLCVVTNTQMLKEIALTPSDRQMSKMATDFVAAARARFKSVSCFDFVPSDYEMAWRVLDSLPRGRFCEWGSGYGVITGLAEILGYEACGIELDERLADAARKLFADFHLTGQILSGDYMLTNCHAETYFVYCWPGKVVETEKHFEEIASSNTRLLICYSQSDIRCMVQAGHAPRSG